MYTQNILNIFFLFVDDGMCLGLGHFSADYLFRGTPTVFCETERWKDRSSFLPFTFCFMLLKVEEHFGRSGANLCVSGGKFLFIFGEFFHCISLIKLIVDVKCLIESQQWK